MSHQDKIFASQWKAQFLLDISANQAIVLLANHIPFYVYHHIDKSASALDDFK